MEYTVTMQQKHPLPDLPNELWQKHQDIIEEIRTAARANAQTYWKNNPLDRTLVFLICKGLQDECRRHKRIGSNATAVYGLEFVHETQLIYNMKVTVP